MALRGFQSTRPKPPHRRSESLRRRGRRVGSRPGRAAIRASGIAGTPALDTTIARRRNRSDHFPDHVRPKNNEKSVQPSCEPMRHGHYSALRFAIITVFFAATGGIASVAFNLFGVDRTDVFVTKLAARIAGFLVTLLFLQYEWLVESVLAHNRIVGSTLEELMSLSQIRTRSTKWGRDAAPAPPGMGRGPRRK